MKVIGFIGKIVFGVFGLIGMLFIFGVWSMEKGWIKPDNKPDYSYYGPWSWLNKFKE